MLACLLICLFCLFNSRHLFAIASHFVRAAQSPRFIIFSLLSKEEEI